jgi:hypothetical protein
MLDVQQWQIYETPCSSIAFPNLAGNRIIDLGLSVEISILSFDIQRPLAVNSVSLGTEHDKF